MIAFVDTNIWVYAADEREPEKQAIAQSYLSNLERHHTIVLSTQVMQEFFNVTTRSGKELLSHDVAFGYLADMSNFSVMESSAQSVMNATALMREHKLSWWDALIVEAAIRAKADRLASEDGQAGRKFGKLIVENPFIVKKSKP
ncbi:MAG: PIN domain-containing protein [Cytophagales bacterium]|nr:PIN domain-containing protein [Cytophagales bacterium]